MPVLLSLIFTPFVGCWCLMGNSTDVIFNINYFPHLSILGMNEKVFLLTSCSCWMCVWRFLSKEWPGLSTCMWALPCLCGNTPDNIWVLTNPLNKFALKMAFYDEGSEITGQCKLHQSTVKHVSLKVYISSKINKVIYLWPIRDLYLHYWHALTTAAVDMPVMWGWALQVWSREVLSKIWKLYKYASTFKIYFNGMLKTPPSCGKLSIWVNSLFIDADRHYLLISANLFC